MFADPKKILSCNYDDLVRTLRQWKTAVDILIGQASRAYDKAGPDRKGPAALELARLIEIRALISASLTACADTPNVPPRRLLEALLNLLEGLPAIVTR